MQKKVQKVVFLAAVYAALLVPAAVYATQGAALSRDYFRDYDITMPCPTLSTKNRTV
jgi:hypothetical protein